MVAGEYDVAGGFRLGPWRVEPTLNRITGPDGERHTEPKVMEVLVCLADRAGRLVPRRELQSAVWGQAIVSDQTLTNAISELRRLLGDNRSEPRFIETVPKRGYRLLGPVEPFENIYTASKSGAAPVARTWTRNPLVAAASATVVVLVGIAAIVIWASRQQLESLPVSPLTTFVGTEWTGSWSPDGSQIAFLHTDQGSADISVMSLGGSERRLIAGGPFDELTPRWSPDGKRVAFLSDRGRGLEVYWVAPTGGAEHRITETGIPFLEQWMGIYALGATPWSPNGQSLVFSRADAEGHVALYRIDVTAGAVAERLTRPPADTKDWDAAWSPNGEWIAFARYGQIGVGLWRVPAAGGEPENLLKDPHSNRGPSWSPDGKRIVFFSDRAGAYNLWTMSARGGRLQPLTAGPGPDFVPVVSQAGRTLFSRWGHQTDLYWMDSTQSEKDHTRLTFNTRENYAPRVSPDGERIAYHSDRSGNPEVWVLDRLSGQERMLTDHPGQDLMPDWSPDGRSLVFLSNRDGAFRLYTIDTGGTGLRKLSEHTVPLSDAYTEVSAFGGPRWSPDGASIGFVAPGAVGPTLWTLDLASGEARASSLEHVLRFDWYVDSDHVVYLSAPGDGGTVHLLAADLASGQERELLTVSCAEFDVNADGSALVFVKAASHFGMNLFRLPLSHGTTLPEAAGEPVALTNGKGVWHVHGGSWSPDGRTIVYTRDVDHGDLYSIDTRFD